MKSTSCSVILMLAVFTPVAYSGPDEFCLDHFDDGDCGESPTSVFYYYKSGSRCEVRTWRGCPTLNKFPDYFSCVHFCVGRIWGEPLDIPVLSALEEAEEKANAVEIAEVVEAQNEWKEELKSLEVEEIQIIDKILEEVVQEAEHHHQKLSLYQENQESSDSGEITTTSELPATTTGFSFEEEEVLVP